MTHPSLMSLGRISMGRNPRTYFDPAEMAELEASVASQGVIQPILIRPFGDAYQLVAGERRYRAAKKVKGEDYEIPVLVKDMTDAEADAFITRLRTGAAPEPDGADPTGPSTEVQVFSTR